MMNITETTDCLDSIVTVDSPYSLMLRALLLVPTSHYMLALSLVYAIFWYNILELHFFSDLFTGFRGHKVILTVNSCSDLYKQVVSKCHLIHGRYKATPWLCSPHLQTLFLRAFGNPPVFNYTRELFQTADGGTVALDWLTKFDVVETNGQVNDGVHIDDKAPIVIVIPGLTSDSFSVYIKHIAMYMAKRGWNVVVSNHRGLGGISLTSDFFYNGGWTSDLRQVVNDLHSRFPETPIYVVGTSLGANMMVKYIGEDGADIPIAGAAAVCNPWDLLLCDRFIRRKPVQKLYNKALAVGLKKYAKLHQQFFSRLADWDGIKKSRSVRDFDTSGTCRIGKFETADMYYRLSSCAEYVKKVKVPLLCISAMDDPVCTNEAIIWDECRANENIILAITEHGGHLGYFEGMNAKSLWWVRTVEEFLTALNSSSLVHKKKEAHISSHNSHPEGSFVDEGPYVVAKDGLVATTIDEPLISIKDSISDAQPSYHTGEDTPLLGTQLGC